MLPRAGRRVGNFAAGVFLAVFYVLGAVAAAVLVAVLTVVGAVRLGWSDVRTASKRGSHGAA